MEIEIHLWNKGLADGYYAVRAEGCTAAALFWGDNQGELKQYSAFAYILLDTKGEGNFKFTGGRAIPREAQGVYVRAGTPDGDGFCGGSYEGYEKIPEEFRPELLLEGECVKMRVGLMSDLHMTDKPVFTVAGNHDITEKTGENYYRFWEKLWKRTEKAFPETERRIDGFAVTLGPGMDLIGLTLCYKNKAFYFSEPESTLRWLDQYLTERRGNCHLLMCHAPLLHYNPQRKPQKHSPYLTRDQAVQGIVTRAGGVIFLSGHTHISPNTPEGCVKWDPIHKNIYINDGSVCPCELKTKENGWPSEWSDGCVTELIFYEKWAEVVMRFLRSGKRISRGQYRFPLSDVC